MYTGFEVGGHCLNCAWREEPQNNSGKKCILANHEKEMEGRNSCKDFITDITLAEHLKKLLSE